jgi:glycosyltransferase involved in cell wall biosynthesis
VRVLIESYSAATRSSYGIVTRNIWERLLRTGYDFEVVQHGWFHAPIEQVPWQIIPTQPPQQLGPGGPPIDSDSHGQYSIRHVLEQTRPDVVWWLSDPWHNPQIAELKKVFRYKLILYCPVDAEPYNVRWAPLIAAADKVVTITDYGKNVLRQVPGLDQVPISTIPHGVDLTMFHNLGKDGKKQAKIQVACTPEPPKEFILGWVGRDQFRKQVWLMFELMHHIKHGDWISCNDCHRITPMEYDYNKRTTREPRENRTYDRNYSYNECWYCGSKNITKGHPRKDIKLWTHMVNRPETGYDLPHLSWIYDVQDVIFNPASLRDDHGIPTAALNVLYNAMDAMVFPSGGEGFGMPVLEAMAAGTPIIYTNYSGHADFAVGLPVRSRFFPEVKSQRFRAIADMGDLIKQVFTMAADRNLRAQLSKRAEKVATKMSWDAYTNNWIDIFETMRKQETKITLGEVL